MNEVLQELASMYTESKPVKPALRSSQTRRSDVPDTLAAVATAA